MRPTWTELPKIALSMGILAAACSPATPAGLVITRLALAEGDTNCSDGPHPVSTADVAMLHLTMRHPERATFERQIDIEPAARSVQLNEIPVGEDWDLRLTGFQSSAAFNAGTYSWLGRRSGVDIAADKGTGAGILLLRAEALQCTRSPMAQAAMLSVATRLSDGRVLITGGVDSFSSGDCDGCRWGIATRSATIYDPVTGSFAATAAMPNARVGHAAALDERGRVIIVGGTNRIRLGGEHTIDLGGSGLRDTSLIFDPSNERWIEYESLWGKRAFHTLTTVSSEAMVAAGGFAEDGRVHSDALRLAVGEDSIRLAETPEQLNCPRVGHQALVYQGELILWGGTRCPDGEQIVPEIWTQRAGVRLADTERWGSEANLSFATAVELKTGTFLIVGGAVYRDGALQTPNRENSYYYLAETETHVRSKTLPEGVPSIFGSSVRMSQGNRAWIGGGFADLGLLEARHGYTVFDDNSETFSPAAQLPGLSGALTATAAGANQALVAGGAEACGACDGGLSTLAGAAVFASAEDH